jgi:flagellar biosynthesis/type III secretory pathway protein FliH
MSEQRGMSQGATPGIFPRIQALAGVAPPWGSGDARSMDVVRVADLLQLQADRQTLVSADAKASEILELARQQAIDHVSRMEQAASQEREQWFSAQGQALEARLSGALAAMPDLVMTVVRSVIASTLESQAEMAIRSSVDMAMRLLHAQVRRDVLCHPLDLDAVRAATDVLEARSVRPHQAVERGALTFVSPQGEITVNGPLAMRTLVDDLQAELRATLSRPLDQPASSLLSPRSNQTPS